LSWNPANLAADLAKIPGLPEARRVGTDGMTPMFAGLIRGLVTPAELVDAAPVMASARRTKTPDEITCLDVASAIAEAALSAMEDALTPGITERELLGIYDERIASLGAPMPPSEKRLLRDTLAWPRHVPAPGVRQAHWRGRTGGARAGRAVRRIRGRPGPHPDSGQWRSAGDCRSGVEMRTGNGRADLGLPSRQHRRRPVRAWENAGNVDPGVPLAHGLGLGAEPPLIGLGRGSDATIDEGMVLSVQSWVTEEGLGGCLERGTVCIESSGPTVLTRYGRL